MNEILRSLWARKSHRVYEDRPIEDEAKQLILESALQAPSAGNMALFSIIDVTDQPLKDKLAISCDNQPFIANASMVLVFLADYQRWLDAFEEAGLEPRTPGEGDLLLAMSDTLIAAQNTVVAAESLGIGSCYIGDIIENYEYHKELLNLPDHAMPVAMLVFGYPTDQQFAREKPKRYRVEDICHQNAYNRASKEQLNELMAIQQNKQGDALENWLKAFCERKYNSDFSIEMSRSAHEIIKAWCK